MVGVEELRNVAVVILPGRQSIAVVVEIADVESAAFSSPDQQSFRVVVKPFFPRILYHESSVVVLVLPFSELNDPVHDIVLHRNGITPETRPLNNYAGLFQFLLLTELTCNLERACFRWHRI